MNENLTYDDKKIEINIRRDNTCKKEQYYTVLQNPWKDYHFTQVIFGGTEQVVLNKCIRQLKKWKKESKQDGN